MIVVDTSALVAILREEAEADAFLYALENATARRLSAGSFLEFQIVTMRRSPGTPSQVPRSTVDRLEIDVVPVDRALADMAAHAYQTYGKGRHPAALNFGDCFAYALAKALDAPLLYKGTDFAATDVAAAAV